MRLQPQRLNPLAHLPHLFLSSCRPHHHQHPVLLVNVVNTQPQDIARHSTDKHRGSAVSLCLIQANLSFLHDTADTDRLHLTSFHPSAAAVSRVDKQNCLLRARASQVCILDGGTRCTRSPTLQGADTSSEILPPRCH